MPKTGESGASRKARTEKAQKADSYRPMKKGDYEAYEARAKTRRGDSHSTINDDFAEMRKRQSYR